MYHPPIQAFSGPPALAVTGMTTGIHWLVAGATLLFFGLALLRLVPRKEA